MVLFGCINCPKEHKELKAMLQANEEFTKNLYTILAKKPGNVFFSPISIHATLSLLYQGANGHTREAFVRTLNVPEVKVAASGYKDIMSRLNSIQEVTLLMANKVFLQENYKLQKAFNKVAVKKFSFGVQLLDFKQPQVASSSINAWVKSKTNNKIKDVISPDAINNDTILVLVSAIYFKGKWVYPFNERCTRTEKFFLNDIDRIDVQMMHIKKHFFYKKDINLNAKVLELPYTNKTISLVIVLPNQRNGIAELEQKLTSMDIMKLTENMDKQEVEVALPKFKIEQTIDLRDTLTELGLGVAFKRREADFSGIVGTTDNLYVSKIIQKSFIEVTEEGTEAAAVTISRARRMSCLSLKKIEEFIADRPFLIILISKEAVEEHFTPNVANILFYGKIADPSIVQKIANCR